MSGETPRISGEETSLGETRSDSPRLRNDNPHDPTPKRSHLARLADAVDDIASDGLTEHLSEEQRGDEHTLRAAAVALREFDACGQHLGAAAGGVTTPPPDTDARPDIYAILHREVSRDRAWALTERIEVALGWREPEPLDAPTILRELARSYDPMIAETLPVIEALRSGADALAGGVGEALPDTPPTHCLHPNCLVCGTNAAARGGDVAPQPPDAAPNRHVLVGDLGWLEYAIADYIAKWGEHLTGRPYTGEFGPNTAGMPTAVANMAMTVIRKNLAGRAAAPLPDTAATPVDEFDEPHKWAGGSVTPGDKP